MDAAERMSILRHDREARKEKMLRQMVCDLIFKLVSEKKKGFFYTHRMLQVVHQMSDTD